MATKTQTLQSSNQSLNIGEALMACVGDPLWFLARQWQTGEFEAENGGALNQMEIQARHFSVESASLDGKQVAVDRQTPLEATIEAEMSNGESLAWQREALEYRFGLNTGSHELAATDYGGFELDWYHFDVSKVRRNTSRSTLETTQVLPSPLRFKGAPVPRWWEMEAGDAYFDSPDDPEPNILSTLLPEFFYTDVENWYVVPTPMPSGSMRAVESVKVTDSFGVTTELNPVKGEDWQVFALSHAKDSHDKLGSDLMFAPNIALDVLHNDTIEDVRFMRDEQANLVWAWEHLYQDETGEPVFNGDGLARPSGPLAKDPGLQDTDNKDLLPQYRLMSETLPNWIPYVPRRIDPNSPNDGSIHLRRGRTDEASTRANPQYKSQIVDESIRIFEEEVPRTGLRVRRIARYARGSDGSAHFWVGRQKDAGRGFDKSGLRFDYLETEPEE